MFRRGASYLTLLTLLSYVMGLFRDVTFARVFGAGRELDLYNAAFIIPDLLLNIFVASALSAAFIPVFNHLLAEEKEGEAQRTAASVLLGAPALILLIGIPTFIFMPSIAPHIAPGFSPAELAELINLSRLMLISPLIFAISNTLGNILISYDRFVAYGLSPVLYNLGIIAGAIGAASYGPYGLVFGTIIGALLHLSVRVIGILKSEFVLRKPLPIFHKNIRNIFGLMIPRMAGQPIEQLTFLAFANFASRFAVGSISMISFARNFQSVPISVFGISFATAVFGQLSRKAGAQDRSGFQSIFGETAKILLVLSIISAVILAFFGMYFIDFFLGGGKFDDQAILTTAKLLALFCLAIPSESIMHLLVRSFYAIKDTWTPILISAPGLLLIIIMSKLLAPILGIYALPLSYGITSNIEALILYLILRRRLK